MTTGILIALSAVCSFLIYLYIKKDKALSADKRINLKALKPSGKKQIITYFLIPITLIAVSLMLNLFYQLSIFEILKRVLLVSILWPIAITDFKEYRVPNNLILTGLICRTIVLISEFIFDYHIAIVTLISDAIALVFVVILCVVCRLIAKGGLGMGDVKLLMLMAIMLGTEGLCYSLFISVIFSSAIAIILLISKKKQKKDVLPFAPFILMGTIISLIISGV